MTELKTPKYIRVRDAILADIRSGVLSPGDKLATRSELMAEHGVSRATVETALGELVRSGVLSTSKRGGTVVTGKRPRMSVAVISNIDEEELKAERGEPHGVLALSRILISSSPDWRLRFIKSDSLRNGADDLCGYDSVVWLQPDDSSLKALERFGEKAIVVNRYPRKNSFVSTNHRQALKELTSLAFEKCGSDCFQAFYLERKRLGPSFVQDERRQGFVDACAEKGLFYRLIELSSDHETAVGELKELPLRPDPKTVVISGTNAFSGAVAKVVAENGWRMNEDFFYADFDNEHSLMRTGAQITTVIQDYLAMGDGVVEALGIVADGGKAEIFVPHKLENGF